MLTEPYQKVFDRIRDMLTQDFIGLPEVPFAVMVGNSRTHQLVELNVFNSSGEHDCEMFDTFSKLTAYEMQADFALIYMEAWTIPRMLMEGATTAQVKAAVRRYGKIERHPEAQEILLVSLECLTGAYRTEMCPISIERRLGAWERVPGPDPEETLSGILEICRDPSQFARYRAFMERLTEGPPPAEMH